MPNEEKYILLDSEAVRRYFSERVTPENGEPTPRDMARDWFGVGNNPGMRDIVLDTRSRVHKLETRQAVTTWIARVALAGVATIVGWIFRNGEI